MPATRNAASIMTRVTAKLAACSGGRCGCRRPVYHL
jgi:hypothetical protein